MNAYLKWLISLSIVWVLFAACEKAKEILTIDFTYNNSNPLPELPGGGGGSCLIPPGVPSYNSLVNSATGMNFVDVPFGYTLAMQGIWNTNQPSWQLTQLRAIQRKFIYSTIIVNSKMPVMNVIERRLMIRMVACIARWEEHVVNLIKYQIV